MRKPMPKRASCWSEPYCLIRFHPSAHALLANMCLAEHRFEPNATLTRSTVRFHIRRRPPVSTSSMPMHIAGSPLSTSSNEENDRFQAEVQIALNLNPNGSGNDN